MKRQKALWRIYVISFLLLGISKGALAQIWNPGHTVGTVSGNYYYQHGQTPDQLVEVLPPTLSAGILTYQWFSSTTPKDEDFQLVAGGQSYSPGPLLQTTYYKRRTLNSSGAFIWSNTIKLSVVSANWEDRNYIREYTVQVTGITNRQAVEQLPIGQKLQATTYLDGLGRGIQNVSRETATPATPGGLWGDVVQFTRYDEDELGRDIKKYLPYTTTTESGKFKTTPSNEQPQYYTNIYNESSAYIQLSFETNPLNRISNIKDAGIKWASGDGHSTIYDVNTADEGVQRFSVDYVAGNPPVYKGAYPEYTLFKLSFIDKTEKTGGISKEKKVIEYYDKEGNLILKKIQLDDAPSTAHAGWICTYYVYDHMGRLRYLIQPEAVNSLSANNWSFAGTIGQQILNGWCYQYNFDAQGRTIWKKGPGANPVNFLYDARDRLILTQDGNQATPTSGTPQWTASLYDDLDRPVISALYNTTKTIAALQSDIDNGSTITTTKTINRPSQPNEVTGTDLVLNQRQAGITRYAATNSIQLTSDANGSFESLLGDEFVAEIDPNATQTTIVTTTTYTSPIAPADLNNSNITTIVKYLYYDDYLFADAKSFNTGFTNSSAYSTSDPNVRSIAASQRTLTMLTGSKTRVLGTNTFLISTKYYDEKGLPIQSLDDNIKGGTDILTRQYHFDGRVLSACHSHTAPGTGYTNYITLSKFNFDKLGRVASVQKQVGGNAFKTIHTYDYDDAGRLKKKGLSPDYTSASRVGLENLNYSYNIQSRLTGINKDYALKNPSNYNKWEHFFGMYLGFDNRDNVFNKERLNGQVAGVLWNTQGDDAQRKYDFTYDNAGRLINADFTEQQHPGDGWSNNKMNFSVSGSSGKITYDLNGNLLSMLHKGVQPGNASPIDVDNLSYSYASFSNKLQSVTDLMTATNVNGLFGDFKDGNNGSDPDYVYDNNGNLVIDLNKNAKDLGNVAGNGIHYNFQDKPDEIHISGKGTIKIIYSGSGEKLQRIYTPDNGTATTTTYIGPYIYEATGNNPDALSFINFSDGRIRVIQPFSQSNSYNGVVVDGVAIDGDVTLPNGKKGVYDYFITDYQQNVRMILTEGTHSGFNTCTMETGRSSAENPVFGQTGSANEVVATRIGTPPGWQSANTSSSVSRLGNLAGYNIGPNTLQKVMAGDEVTASSLYYYDGPASGDNPNLVNNLLTSLGQSIAGGGAAANLVKSNVSGVTTGLNGTYGFVNAVRPANSGTNPKAYLNILFFDERFKFIEAVDGGVAQQQVATSGPGATPLGLNIKAPKNGYVYVYVSNESDQHVYFDDFKVAINRGNIIEENHYYAYGLKIAALSSRKAGDVNEGKLKNGYLYNDNELFDDADLNWYEYGYRNYDPQIGRFVQIDPIADEMPALSGYHYAYNDPVTNVDEDGLIGIECPGTSALSIFLSSAGAAISNALTSASTAINIVAMTASVTNTVALAEEQIQGTNAINGTLNAVQIGSTVDPEPKTGTAGRASNQVKGNNMVVRRNGRIYQRYKRVKPSGWGKLLKVVRKIGTKPITSTIALVFLPSNAFDDPENHPENRFLTDRWEKTLDEEQAKAEDEYEKANPDQEIRYVTYTKIKYNEDGTYQIYSGRTSGPATMTAAQLVARRDAQHQREGRGIKDGFSAAKVDEDATGSLKRPFGKWAIRGREQQLIDKNGGAHSDTKNFPGGGSSANKIRGVWYYNPKARLYHDAANRLFQEELHKYTGFF